MIEINPLSTIEDIRRLLSKKLTCLGVHVHDYDSLTVLTQKINYLAPFNDKSIELLPKPRYLKVNHNNLPAYVNYLESCLMNAGFDIIGVKGIKSLIDLIPSPNINIESEYTVTDNVATFNGTVSLDDIGVGNNVVELVNKDTDEVLCEVLNNTDGTIECTYDFNNYSTEQDKLELYFQIQGTNIKSEPIEVGLVDLWIECSLSAEELGDGIYGADITKPSSPQLVIKYGNNGLVDAHNFKVKVNLPEGITSNGSSMGYDVSTNSYNLNELEAGKEDTISVALSINAELKDYLINVETTSNDIDKDTSNNSQDLIFRYYPHNYLYDLSLTQSLNKQKIAIGDSITVTNRIVNNGEDTAEDIIIENYIPNDAELVTSMGEIDTETNTLNLGNLTRNASRTLSYTIKYNEVGTYTHTTKITGLTDDYHSDTDLSNNETSYTIQVLNPTGGELTTKITDFNGKYGDTIFTSNNNIVDNDVIITAKLLDNEDNPLSNLPVNLTLKKSSTTKYTGKEVTNDEGIVEFTISNDTFTTTATNYKFTVAFDSDVDEKYKYLGSTYTSGNISIRRSTPVTTTEDST